MELDEALKILNESGFYADLDGDSDRIFPGAVKRKMIPPPEVEMDNLLKLKDYFIDCEKDGNKYNVVISTGKNTRNSVKFEYWKPKQKPQLKVTFRWWNPKLCEEKFALKLSFLDLEPQQMANWIKKKMELLDIE